jgi:hypothetical protein
MPIRITLVDWIIARVRIPVRPNPRQGRVHIIG